MVAKRTKDIPMLLVLVYTETLWLNLSVSSVHGLKVNLKSFPSSFLSVYIQERFT